MSAAYGQNNPFSIIYQMNARYEQTVIFCDLDPVLIFKTQSKSNHSPKNFSNAKSKPKWSPEFLKNAAFHNKNPALIFH